MRSTHHIHSYGNRHQVLCFGELNFDALAVRQVNCNVKNITYHTYAYGVFWVCLHYRIHQFLDWDCVYAYESINFPFRGMPFHNLPKDKQKDVHQSKVKHNHLHAISYEFWVFQPLSTSCCSQALYTQTVSLRCE